MLLTTCMLAGYFILICALAFPYLYGYSEGHWDSKKIRRNGAKDTLKERWHRNNLIRRGVVLATGALIFGTLLIWILEFGYGFIWAYAFYAATMFGYHFTTTLNCKRGLNRWYVSHDPRASETDKFMIRGSAYMGMQPQSFNRLLHTGFAALGILLLLGYLWIFHS